MVDSPPRLGVVGHEEGLLGGEQAVGALCTRLDEVVDRRQRVSHRSSELELVDEAERWDSARSRRSPAVEPLLTLFPRIRFVRCSRYIVTRIVQPGAASAEGGELGHVAGSRSRSRPRPDAGQRARADDPQRACARSGPRSEDARAVERARREARAWSRAERASGTTGGDGGKGAERGWLECVEVGLQRVRERSRTRTEATRDELVWSVVRPEHRRLRGGRRPARRRPSSPSHHRRATLRPSACTPTHTPSRHHHPPAPTQATRSSPPPRSPPPPPSFARASPHSPHTPRSSSATR